jgi:ribosomal protein S21
MALRQAYTRFISLRNFAPTAAAAVAVSTVGLSHAASPLLVSPAAQLPTLQQSRTAITVPVQNNKVPRALRRLTRTIYGDRLLQEWRDRQHFTKPAKRRFEAKKATELRLRKEEFREKLRWAMQRKARYVDAARVAVWQSDLCHEQHMDLLSPAASGRSRVQCPSSMPCVAPQGVLRRPGCRMLND